MVGVVLVSEVDEVVDCEVELSGEVEDVDCSGAVSLELVMPSGSVPSLVPADVDEALSWFMSRSPPATRMASTTSTATMLVRPRGARRWARNPSTAGALPYD